MGVGGVVDAGVSQAGEEGESSDEGELCKDGRVALRTSLFVAVAGATPVEVPEADWTAIAAIQQEKAETI